MIHLTASIKDTSQEKLYAVKRKKPVKCNIEAVRLRIVKQLEDRFLKLRLVLI